MLRSLAAAAAAAALGGPAAAAPPPATPGDVSLFQEGRAYVMRSNDSLPLYTFDKDAHGRSNCTGSCGALWPPLIASEGSKPVGEWTLVKRDDGSLQWAWRGRPVYTYAKDAPAKPSGEGVGGVWRLIPPIAR